MAKSDRRPKADEGDGKDERPNEKGRDKPYAEDDLIRALNHAVRRQALRLLHSSREPLSPGQIEAQLKLGKKPKDHLSKVSYHLATMARLKVVSLVGEQQVRGAMEHFYASEVSDSAWVRNLLKRTQESDEAQLWPKGRR
jgi:Helix-turn-helix domain